MAASAAARPAALRFREARVTSPTAASSSPPNASAEQPRSSGPVPPIAPPAVMPATGAPAEWAWACSSCSEASRPPSGKASTREGRPPFRPATACRTASAPASAPSAWPAPAKGPCARAAAGIDPLRVEGGKVLHLDIGRRAPVPYRPGPTFGQCRPLEQVLEADHEPLIELPHPSDGQQYPRHERLARDGVVADGQGLSLASEDDLLMGDKPRQPDRVDRLVDLAPALADQLRRAGGRPGGSIQLRGVVELDDLALGH